jgi:hypothetical protein
MEWEKARWIFHLIWKTQPCLLVSLEEKAGHHGRLPRDFSVVISRGLEPLEGPVVPESLVVVLTIAQNIHRVPVRLEQPALRVDARLIVWLLDRSDARRRMVNMACGATDVLGLATLEHRPPGQTEAQQEVAQERD